MGKLWQKEMVLSSWTLLLCFASSSSQRTQPAAYITTVVGAPEVLLGPTGIMFDSPFLAIRNGAGVTLSYTANADNYLVLSLLLGSLKNCDVRGESWVSH